MAIPAHFERSDDPPKRREPRRRLLLDAQGKPSSGAAGQVLVHNISATGLLIECATELSIREAIEIELPHAGPTKANVIWHSGRLHGCQFAEPLGQAALSAAELRGAVEGPSALAAPERETLAQRLHSLRAARGLSLDELADKLGVSKPSVWAWERGRSRPADERIAKLADALGVDIAELAQTRDTPALRELLAQSRGTIAEAFGTDPANVRIMIEL